MTRKEFEALLEEAFEIVYDDANTDIFTEGLIQRLKTSVGNFVDDVKAAGGALKSIQNKNSYKNFYLGSNGVREKRARYQAAQDSNAPEHIKKKLKKEYDDAMEIYNGTRSNKWKVFS